MLSHFFDLRSRDILPYNLADGSLQHFIAAGADAGDSRPYFAVRNYPDALIRLYGITVFTTATQLV